MPVQVSYPGVYVQEVPSTAHSIVGVSTSAAAFVGIFKRGPVGVATRIDGMGDFERTFGGLWDVSEASYAISQFFMNGGQTAWVVRVVGDNAKAASVTLGPVEFSASSEGDWGNNLQVSVADGEVGPNGPTFSVAVREMGQQGGTSIVLRTERYFNLTHTPGPRFVEEVLAHESDLIDATVTDKDTADGRRGQKSLFGQDVDPTERGPRKLPAQHLNSTEQSDAWHQLSLGNADLDTGDPVAIMQLIQGDEATNSGMYALGQMAPHIFNILCLPDVSRLDWGSQASAVHTAAAAFCEKHRAFYLVDLPVDQDDDGKVTDLTTAITEAELEAAKAEEDEFENMALSTLSNLSPNAAVYYPDLMIPDPLRNNRPRTVGTSGTIAGLMARTDTDRGIWKAPAGTEATLRGATPSIPLTDAENGELNEDGFNVLRTFPVYGSVCWGARTLQGADILQSEWKYVPVRRLTLYIEESLFQGTKWAVFEPNDEPLWAQLRLTVGTFMHELFRQGAFEGTSPQEAYFVRCDHTTTSQPEIDAGIVNIEVGFAPLKPAEFVVVNIQQIAPE